MSAPSVTGCGLMAWGSIKASAAPRSAWPEAVVVTAPTIRPLRVPIGAWPMKHSRASLPSPPASAGAGFYETGGPRDRSSSPMAVVAPPLAVKVPLAPCFRRGRLLRPGSAGSPEPSPGSVPEGRLLGRKLFRLAQASSNVPPAFAGAGLTEKCSLDNNALTLSCDSRQSRTLADPPSPAPCARPDRPPGDR